MRKDGEVNRFSRRLPVSAKLREMKSALYHSATNLTLFNFASVFLPQ